MTNESLSKVATPSICLELSRKGRGEFVQVFFERNVCGVDGVEVIHLSF